MPKIKKTLKKTLRIMRFVKPVWPLYVLSAGLALVVQLSGLIHPWLMKIFLDDVLINQKFDLFYIIIAAFVIIYFVGRGLYIVSGIVNVKLSQKQQLHIKDTAYKHIQSLHMDFFHKKKVGDILTRINSDALSIESFINTIINTIFVSSITLIVTVYISFTIDYKVTLLALSVFPFYLLSEKFWLKRLTKISKKLRIKGADVLSFLQENLTAIKAIKIFTQEKRTSDKYRNKLKDVNKWQYKNVLTNDAASLINGFIIYIPTFIILAFGGYQVLLGAMTVGGLIALQQYVGRVYGPVMNLATVNRNLRMEMIGINRIFEVLDAKPEVVDKPDSKEIKSIDGKIEFKNVKFRYDKNQPVLENINGIIEAGNRIGLVGGSGVGKTTLVNLLFRFYEPQGGKILLDGMHLDDIKLKSLRSKIGFVSQDNIIFHKSIKDNIAFSKPRAKMKEVVSAARVAGIHDFINKLPGKYNTVVGERGEILSGGQKQRLSIARVILENPDIIVLDEPTSYLDSETEEKVKGALDYVTKDKTTIVIAHRLATLKNIDEIWVLNDGRIAERGKFSDLLDKKGEFFKYYVSQFRGFEIFSNRLNLELSRAKNNKPFHLVRLDVKDWQKHDKNHLTGNELVSDILLELAQNLDNIYFSTHIPQKRGTFLVALPETNGKEADKVAKFIKHRLSRKFHHLELESKVISKVPLGKSAEVSSDFIINSVLK
ncbi:ABC transporter ATP-binding protein [Patescibacteria group bacterium]